MTAVHRPVAGQLVSGHPLCSRRQRAATDVLGKGWTRRNMTSVDNRRLFPGFDIRRTMLRGLQRRPASFVCARVNCRRDIKF